MGTDGALSRKALVELGGPVFDGRFRVEQRIAEGGFAVVYRAWQVALERRVALKVLKPPRNQDAVGRAEFRERFAAEAKTIARLRHPDIVDVYDFSVATLPSGELAPWMALEWLDGETLALQLGRRRLGAQRRRDPAEAIDLLRPVMRALAHAHQQGIVHRDIKPSNIMVTETPHGPSLRVLDFGIAKIMVDIQAPNTGNTRTESAPMFSPAYAAPEQVAFSRTGPWTDVHALGLVLTELMTDEPPFYDADPDAHLFEQVMAARRPTPASKGLDVGRFEPIIAKALALSPRDRWRNAGELMAALMEAGTGRGVAASDLSAVAPARRRIARPTALALGLGAAALALVGGAWTAEKRANDRTRHTVGSPPKATAAPPRRLALTPAVVSGGDGRTQGTPTITRTESSPASATTKVKRRARAAPAPAPSPVRVEDGRDLFNDTR